MRCVLLVLATVASWAVAACATSEPFSYLNGYRFIKAELNTFDARIISVDAVSYLQNSSLRVDPGVRTIVLEAPPAAGFHCCVERAIVVRIEPCMQYWFGAKKTNPLAQDWKPYVNYSAPIAGCKP